MTCGCQWVGAEQNPLRGPLEFCGKTPLWPGRSYCEEHVWRVYKKDSGMGNKRKNKAIEKEMAELKRLEEIADDV